MASGSGDEGIIAPPFGIVKGELARKGEDPPIAKGATEGSSVSVSSNTSSYICSCISHQQTRIRRRNIPLPRIAVVPSRTAVDKADMAVGVGTWGDLHCPNSRNNWHRSRLLHERNCSIRQNPANTDRCISWNSTGNHCHSLDCHTALACRSDR